MVTFGPDKGQSALKDAEPSDPISKIVAKVKDDLADKFDEAGIDWDEWVKANKAPADSQDRLSA